MKVGDIIKTECCFCGKKHEFRVAGKGVDGYKGRFDCVIVRREDCPKGIYCQWEPKHQ